ncbi:C40 family peptidase [Actinomadura sp. HBU206391]|uniref:C40 family peptidase n=1 Tax=Actinomadura sp. HBU206391 TaxID=2731692 RepID=UPI001D367A6A|nr:C40 family peptidase [Actinomadura sp. HBU206391]MBC6457754.1 C40 family peptidase [Actinomadura sp. HBU206391]
MRLARYRDAGRDKGSTQIIMLMAMVCAFALTLMAVQVAQANDMRTKAQTAADAAAIGALTPLRDEAVSLAQDGRMPGIGLWMVVPDNDVDDPVYNKAARTYANRNHADLAGKVKVSGSMGYTMKASVQTKDCVIKDPDKLTAKERDDLAHKRNICTDNEGNVGIPEGRGTATAIAQLKMPTCKFRYQVVNDPAPLPPGEEPEGDAIPVELKCDGKTVWEIGRTIPRSQIIPVFKIRLVAKEDSTPYTGIPMPDNYSNWNGELPPLPENASDLVKKIIAFAYSKVGMPYVWGGESDAEGGYDCSGIIYAAYLSAGVSIPRTTFGQWPFGVQVPAGSEQPGDLVFFSSGPNNGPNSPGHVALVVDPAKKIAVEASCTNCGPIRPKSYAGRNVVGFTRPLARFGKE